MTNLQPKSVPKQAPREHNYGTPLRQRQGVIPVPPNPSTRHQP
eukprot:CAMPEP_0174916734 /NCGR_PEP_ID=MMETSP1355-20121228/2014_1 /TAXON_ID=464990 /ORGANISM="Hemiselmis tepida, Strain CCMP443" /LENGTH=42 /DNA_ID= /DNA_START= /DNA_END= /DNA_ORIENTATION=